MRNWILILVCFLGFGFKPLEITYEDFKSMVDSISVISVKHKVSDDYIIGIKLSESERAEQDI